MNSFLFVLSSLIIGLTAHASTIELHMAEGKPSQAQMQERQVDYYSYNFGRVWLNSSQYASYRLTNTGSTPLTFLQATISGSGYSARHNCNGVVLPHQVCRFDIRYNPFFVGFDSGRFVLSFVEDLDLVADLWGEGYRP